MAFITDYEPCSLTHHLSKNMGRKENEGKSYI